jgi:hypothetical protein
VAVANEPQRETSHDEGVSSDDPGGGAVVVLA